MSCMAYVVWIRGEFFLFKFPCFVYRPVKLMFTFCREESHRVPASAAEPESKSSMWQNLKSFANVIVGMWRGS